MATKAHLERLRRLKLATETVEDELNQPLRHLSPLTSLLRNAQQGHKMEQPMDFIPIACPVCGNQRCINGRARCRCGTYLIARIGRTPFFFDKENTWFRQDDDTWLHARELHPASTPPGPIQT